MPLAKKNRVGDQDAVAAEDPGQSSSQLTGEVEAKPDRFGLQYGYPLAEAGLTGAHAWQLMS